MQQSYLILKRIEVNDFRNLEKQVISFGPKQNIFIGQNGQGKTNLLEAIYLLVTRKSFKNASYPQFLSFDVDNPRLYVQALFTDHNGSNLRLGLSWDTQGPKWFRDGIQVRYQPFPAVFIGPYDSHQFYGSKSFRRQWLDSSISALFPEYGQKLKRYQKALRFKNKILSSPANNKLRQINAIEEEISLLIPYINETRIEFLKDLQKYLLPTFEKIFDESFCLEISLKTKCEESMTPEMVLAEFDKRRQKEALIGRSLFGPHLDDVELWLDSLSALDFASVGQQKMSYLGLQFAYIELFRYKYHSYPLVLIDDLSGELDRTRWDRFVNFLSHGPNQIIMTTANESFGSLFGQDEFLQSFSVHSGAIKSGHIVNKTIRPIQESSFGEPN